MAKKKTANSKKTVKTNQHLKAEESVKGKVVNDNETTDKAPKKPDKKFIALVAVCAAIIVFVEAFLMVRGLIKNKPDTTTKSTTKVQATMTDQEIERKMLFDEHDALFAKLRDVYWLGKYEEYKSLIPLEAWEAMAKEEEMTLEEIYAAVEEELSVMEIEGNDVKFYIASLNIMSDKDKEEIVTRFSNMYNIELSDIGQVCIMDIEMVHIEADGTKKSTDEVYYSFQIRGERYLATENGFVG